MLEGLSSIIACLRDGQEEAFLRELEIEGFTYEQKITSLADSDLVRIFAHDITERKRAEAAVRESEARFHSIFEHSNDAIFLIDISADEILDVNSKGCRSSHSPVPLRQGLFAILNEPPLNRLEGSKRRTLLSSAARRTSNS